VPKGRVAGSRAACALVGCLLLVGCGGGGSSGVTNEQAGASPAETPNSPVNQSASVQFSATTLTLTGDTSRNVNPIDSTIQVTLQNRPSNGVWTRATNTGLALYSANVNWSTETEGRLQIVPRTPRSLGAGTYDVTLQVEVCADAECASQIAGSPVNIAVTYVVTGSATPLSQANWGTAQLNGTPFHTNQATSPQFSMRLSVQDPPVSGLYVRYRLAANSVFASVVLDEVAANSYVWEYGDFTVTLKAPAALGSGEFHDSIEFEVCYDAACTRPIPGGAHTAQVSFLVLATEGVEYTRRSVTPPRGASEVVWSAANQSFYILSNRDAPRHPDPGIDPQIARVDPVTLQLDSTVDVPGENLRRLTVTPDGSRLYVASQTQSMVYRFTLPTMTRDLSLSLESSPPQDPIIVNDFAVLTGHPESFAVTLVHKNRTHAIRVYDNEVMRPRTIAPSLADESPRWLVPTAEPETFVSHLYAWSAPAANTLERFSIDSAGIHQLSSAPTNAQVLLTPKPPRVANKLYSSFGRIYDIDSGAQVGTFGQADNTSGVAVAIDEANGRIFLWRAGFLMSYDLITLKMLAIAKIDVTPYWNQEPAMVPWGSGGVAMTNGEQLVVLSGSLFTTYRGAGP
jgi:hypothetical protein